MNDVRLQLSDFEPYYSQIYSVGAMVVDKEFEFDNELGEGHYEAKPGDIVLEGTQGEHLIVPASKLIGDKAKYEIDGHPIDLDMIAKGHSLDTEFTQVSTKESKAITWAAQVVEPDVHITSPEGHQLTANNSAYEHGGGDFICCSDNNGKPSFEWGCWPVNGSVFVNTYELADIEYDLDFHEADDLLEGDGTVGLRSDEGKDLNRDEIVIDDNDDHDTL